MNSQNLINEQIKSYKSLIKEIEKLNSDKTRKSNKRIQLDQELKLIDTKLKELESIKQSMEKAFDGFNNYLSKYNDQSSNEDGPHV